MRGQSVWVLATAALVGIGGGTEPGSIPSHLSERTWDLEEELWYVASPPQEVAHISAHDLADAEKQYAKNCVGLSILLVL